MLDAIPEESHANQLVHTPVEEHRKEYPELACLHDTLYAGLVPDRRQGVEALHHAIERFRNSGAPPFAWFLTSTLVYENVAAVTCSVRMYINRGQETLSTFPHQLSFITLCGPRHNPTPLRSASESESHPHGKLLGSSRL